VIARFWNAIAFAIVFSALAAAQTSAATAPDSNQQADLLNKMSEYAEKYVADLPNFLCTQVTGHFESGLKHVHWSKGDIVVAQLSYSGGKEQQKIVLVNNKAPKTEPRSWRWKLTTSGEFGAKLANVFAESSKAGYSWNRWDTLRGRPVAVFDYTIQKENSLMTLIVMGVRAVVAYRGTVWGDPVTGQVWRVEDHALDIPSELQREEIGTTIDFDPVEIAGRTYVLPVHAETIEQRHSGYEKNEVDFRDYKQFRADSTLRFDVPDEPQK
jgi:hypothetical protein